MIEGYYGNQIVFTLSIDAAGEVTLTQNEALDHVGEGNDSNIALAEGLVSDCHGDITGDGDTADPRTADLR